jgi:hypothetical protein
MPSHNVLQKLDGLDRFSYTFPDLLSGVLYGKEYQQCVPNLQSDDSVWLVDYLDRVRHRIVLPHSPLKPP